MPYYNAGDYYMAGDNYAAGGLFSFLGNVAKKVAGTALSLSPVGRIAQTAVKLVTQPRRPTVTPLIDYSGGGMDVDVAGATAIPTFRGSGGGRRRMNPLNLKALRRANRRAHSFLNAVRGAVRYYVPKAPKGKAYVAFRKKRRA